MTAPVNTHDDNLPALFGALSNAQGHGRGAEKDRRHGMGFDYASSENVIAAGRAALSEYGLALAILSTVIDATGDRPYVRRRYWLTHEGGAHIDIEQSWPISGGRDAGKALAAAQTSMLAYQLRDLLLIPRVAPEDDLNHEPMMQGSDKQASDGVPPDVPPTGEGHHSSFAAHRGRFMAELARRQLGYTGVRDFCVARFGEKPSQWPTDGRARFLADLDAGVFKNFYDPEKQQDPA